MTIENTMRQINLPLPKYDDDELVEIEVKTSRKGKTVFFRLVPFLWETDEILLKKGKTTSSLDKINLLKNLIENYDKSWELIQIFAPLKKSNYIRILYRKHN